MDVWILWHIPPGTNTVDAPLLIGVYSTRDSANVAVSRLGIQPGFREFPGVTADDDVPGFYMQAYRLDQDNWTSGYRRTDDEADL